MKRHSNTAELFLSPSIHRLRHRKQSHLIKQKTLHENNRSISSSLHIPSSIPIKSTYSTSYTSLNSSLKDFYLSDKDFLELRQALKTIFSYVQSQVICDHHRSLTQRLTSPYLQNQLNNGDQYSLPLYTDEYFIRNGLLNHNDGPSSLDQYFQPTYVTHSQPYSIPSSSSMMFTSPTNISLPLALLSNQKYLFTALTSNFTSEQPRCFQSDSEVNLMKYFKKQDDEHESDSIIVRRNKVQTWKRENIHQQTILKVCSSVQLEGSEYHRSSIVRTLSTNEDTKNTEKSIGMNSVLLVSHNKEKRNEKSSEITITDDLFPMVKVLAPYILIRDSLYSNISNSHHSSSCILMENIDRKKNVQQTDYSTTTSEKRPSRDATHPSSPTPKRRSIESAHREKKNYLLAEFESVLTQITKR